MKYDNDLQTELMNNMQKFLGEQQGRGSVRTAGAAGVLAKFAGELASIASDLEEAGALDLSTQAEGVLEQFCTIVAPETK